MQALFAAAAEEDFEDTDDTGVLPADEVKSLKDELKEATVEWKALLKRVKDLATDLYTEIRAAGRVIPEGKAFYCGDGFAQKDAEFENGNRVLGLAKDAGHKSEFITPLCRAIKDGSAAHERAQRVEESLARHKALENEQKDLKAALKAIKDKREALITEARLKITKDEARQIITERLGRQLKAAYEGYLRNDQRACVHAIENLWDKYAVTARQLEEARDDATRQLQGFLVELGYA